MASTLWRMYVELDIRQTDFTREDGSYWRVVPARPGDLATVRELRTSSLLPISEQEYLDRCRPWSS